MLFKPLSHIVLSCALIVTGIGLVTTSAVHAAEQHPNIHKQAQPEGSQETEESGQVSKSKTKSNTSEAIDFNEAQNLTPKQRIDQLTEKDKSLHNKDMNDSDEKVDNNTSSENNNSSFRSANGASIDINEYIKNNNIEHAPIIEDNRIDSLPKYNYKSGKYVGVVVHDTANDNSTLENEVNYMYNNYNSAFVHAYTSSNEIRQTAPADYLAWGAGANANPYFYQIELAHAHSYEEFAKSVNNDAYLTAYMLKRNGLQPKLADTHNGDGTVISHNAVSKYYGGTDHTDPVGYFERWGYDMNQYFDLVQYHYNKLNEKTTDSTNEIKGTTHKVVKGDTLYNISKRSGVSVDNLKKWNNLKNNTIALNRNIYLVPAHKVTKGETLYRIATSNDMTVEELKSLNNLTSNSIKVGQMLRLK